MTAAFLHPLCLPALLLALAAPALALAASPAMQKASISLTEKSVSAVAAGDAKRARRLLEEAVVADPANARALGLLGHLHQSQGNASLAHKYYELAFGVDPVEPEALLGAGMLDLAEGKPDEARNRLRKLGMTCPGCRQTKELGRALDEMKISPEPGQSLNQPTHP